MKNPLLPIIIVIIIAALAIGGWAFYRSQNSASALPAGNSGGTAASSTASSTELQSLTFAGGEVSIAYPVSYGLAASAAQLPIHSYIPACNQGFEYCLYYNGNAYAGTNFESAGIRVNRRQDLGVEHLCLATPPEGHSASVKPQATRLQNAYSTSVFTTGDAAAGHYAQGLLYRIFVRQSSSCYELETRVGVSQFANYPAGTIREFTAADQQKLLGDLDAIVRSATLVQSNLPVAF